MKSSHPIWPRILLVCLLALSARPPAMGQPFVNVGTSFPGVVYGAVDWGDYDSDRDPDLLISGGVVGAVISRVYRNDGGAFTGIQANLPGAVTFAAGIWSDPDGDLDIFRDSTDRSAGKNELKN